LFDSANANIPYKGMHVLDIQECEAWLNGAVRTRAYDEEEVAALHEFLVVEGFDNSAISAIFAVPDEPLAQQDIGETIAELALQAELQAVWPTNRRRDMRSVRASLPGADIVGFVPCAGGYRFLFGEVKTSSDKKSPPAVMYGDTGLEFQLHTLATDVKVLRRLLSYVFSRVRDTELMGMWHQAFERLSDQVLMV
jgi:hypothetical protein